MKWLTKNPEKALIFYFIFYYACVLLNLHLIPVAWLDETMGLEPAVNFIKEGKYVSYIWPQPETEKVFLSYLPTIQWFNILWLSVFPIDIYWVRLPYVLIFISCIIFLYKTYKLFNINPLLIVFLIFVFVNDKGIYESLRSFRSEVIEIALLAPLLYLFFKERLYPIQALLGSILFLTHPSLWVIIALLLLYGLIKNKLINKILAIIIFSSPILIYLIYADFNLDLFYKQFILHGQEHTVQGNIFIKHFINRFWPFYKTQAWIILLNLFIQLAFVYDFIKDKNLKSRFFALAGILTSIYWFFVLEAHYRYNTPWILYLFIALGYYINKYELVNKIYFKPLFKKIILIVLLPLIVFPFFSRNVLSQLQKEARDPYKAMQWLNQNLDSNKKILLIENSLAYYYSIDKPNVDFTLIYSVNKYKFEDYDEVYLVSVRDIGYPKTPKAIYSAYEVKPENIGLNQVITYEGLSLYRANSSEEMQSWNTQTLSGIKN